MQALLFEEDNFRSVFASKSEWREAIKILGFHSIKGKKRKKKMFITDSPTKIGSECRSTTLKKHRKSFVYL